MYYVSKLYNKEVFLCEVLWRRYNVMIAFKWQKGIQRVLLHDFLLLYSNILEVRDIVYYSKQHHNPAYYRMLFPILYNERIQNTILMMIMHESQIKLLIIIKCVKVFIPICHLSRRLVTCYV